MLIGGHHKLNMDLGRVRMHPCHTAKPGRITVIVNRQLLSRRVEARRHIPIFPDRKHTETVHQKNAITATNTTVQGLIGNRNLPGGPPS